MNRLTDTVSVHLTGWHLLVWICFAAGGLVWAIWGVLSCGWYLREFLIARTAYYRTHTDPPPRGGARHRHEEG